MVHPAFSEAMRRVITGDDANGRSLVVIDAPPSAEIGAPGLGVKQAVVLDQVRPGVPVWSLGAESRFPGVPFVVFPGNVGGAATLAGIVSDLVARRV